MVTATLNPESTVSRVIAHNKYSQEIEDTPEPSVLTGITDCSTTTLYKEEEPLLYTYSEGELKEILLKPENIHLRNFLIIILEKVLLWIEEREAVSKPKFYLWKDYEISGWQKVVIEVATRYEDLDEEDKLWEELEEVINQATKEYENLVGIAGRAEALRKTISPCIEELHDD